MKFKYDIVDGEYVALNSGEEIVVREFPQEGLPEEIEHLVRRYKALLSLEYDLKYANQYLKQMFFGKDTTLIDGALISMAAEILIKCFTNPNGKGRPGLNEKVVFSKYAKEKGKRDYLENYNDLKKIRNQSLIHDEMNYLNNKVFLTIDVNANKAIEVPSISLRPTILNKQTYDILHEMTDLAKEYVKEQEDVIAQKILCWYSSESVKPELVKADCKDIKLSNSW